jgi:hypothetical protein
MGKFQRLTQEIRKGKKLESIPPTKGTSQTASYTTKKPSKTRKKKVIDKIKLPDKDFIEDISSTPGDFFRQREIARLQIEQLYNDIEELREINNNGKFQKIILDTSTVLNKYIKLWLDEEHRRKDKLDSSASSELLDVTTTKLDGLIQIIAAWDCQCCRHVLLNKVEGILKDHEPDSEV